MKKNEQEGSCMTKGAFARAAVAALCCILLVACSASAQSKRDKYLARGKALVEKKEYLRAILEFRNAARAMPGDADVYYEIGLAYLNSNDIRTGYAALKKAIELNPKHRDAQLRIARLLSMTNEPTLLKEAEGRLQALLSENAAGVDVLNALAFTELRLGKTENAIRNFEEALSRFPGELQSSVMLARARLAQGEAKEAEEVLKKACAEAPRSPDARRVLGEFYVDQRRLEQAEAEFRAALLLDANNGPALLDLGRLLLLQGKAGEAEATYKRMVSIEGYKQVYGLFLLEQGQDEAAIAEFKRLAEEDRDDRASRTRLIAAYRRLGRYQEADVVLSEALKRSAKDSDALLQRGEIALQAGRYGDAEVDFNRVLQLRPNAAEAHYMKAKLHQARGDKRLYRQELGEALRLNAALEPVRVELARDYVNQNEVKAALDVLDGAPEAHRQSPALMIQRNWAYWAAGDMPAMRRGIDMLLTVGASPDVLLQDGAWKLKSGDRKGARAALDAALKINPSDLRALQVMQQTYLPQENALALQKVKEFAVQHPKSPAAQEFLGTMLMSSGKLAEARTAFDAARSADPQASSVDYALVRIDVLERNLDGARKRLEAMLPSDGRNGLARQWLASVEVMRGDLDAAAEHFRKVVETNPGDAQSANNLAYLLIEHRKQVDEGLKYAQKAVELVPDNGAYCDTLGWALYRKGMYDAAVKYLERTENVPGGNPVWKYHLAMAYAKSGDTTRGRKTLQAALSQNPNVSEAKLAKAVVEGQD